MTQVQAHRRLGNGKQRHDRFTDWTNKLGNYVCSESSLMVKRTSQPILKAFAPVGAQAARLLILGSMPGVASLAETEYYAHPRNAFWPIMQALFGGSINTYTDKRKILINNHIVIWDVLTQCIRPGSLDANIRKDSVVCNNFAAFFDKQTNVSLVAFNGKASQQLFKKHVLPKLVLHFSNDPAEQAEHIRAEQVERRRGSTDTPAKTIQFISLPSTSPAMASLTQNDKILAWRKALLQGNAKHLTLDNQV